MKTPFNAVGAKPTGASWREGVLSAGPGSLLLLIAFAKPWWHLIQSPEPLEARACRLLCLLLAARAAGAILSPRSRTQLLLRVGGAALCLPLCLLLTIVIWDAAAISAAVAQTDQANHLIGFIERSDVNPYIGWTQNPRMISYAGIRNDYTFIDGLETAAAFAKEGWYSCLLGGLWLFSAAWIGDGLAARRCFARWRVCLSLGLALLIIGTLARRFPAYYYLNRARAMQMHREYGPALACYQQALKWEPQLDYDLTFHYELGRLYARSGQTRQPDYWASVAEMYNNAGQMQQAYELYQCHVSDPYANPALTSRYTQMLLKSGVIDYTSGLTGSAVPKWEHAIRLDPTNVEIMYALAMGHTRLGNYAQAIAWWKHLIRANESVGLFRSKFVVSFIYRKVITARAWAHLGWCYFRQGDMRAARYCQQMSTLPGASNTDAVP